MASPIGLPLRPAGQSFALGQQAAQQALRFPQLQKLDQLNMLQAQAELQRQPLLDEQARLGLEQGRQKLSASQREEEVKKVLAAAAMARTALKIEDDEERREFLSSFEFLRGGTFNPGEESIEKLQQVVDLGDQLASKPITALQRFESQLKTEKNKFDQAAKIRGEVDKSTKIFRDVQDSFSRVKASQTGEVTAASDLALIFNFMKMLDPGSVVREGEFATAQNAAGVPDRVRNVWNRLVDGERLNPDQRKNFVAEAKKQFDSAKKLNKKREDDFVALAKRFDLSKEDVIVRREEAQEETQKEPPKTPQSQQPKFKEGDTATNPNTGEKIIFRNGVWQKM